MGSKRLWQGMDRSIDIKLTDKLLVGNIDNGEPEFIDVGDLPTNTGPQSPQGPVGLAGPAGEDGAQGPSDPDGAQRPAGEDGAQDPAGQGVPAGGTNGQVLAKSSSEDYATHWVDPMGGGLSTDLLNRILNARKFLVSVVTDDFEFAASHAIVQSGGNIGKKVINRVEEGTIVGVLSDISEVGETFICETADSTFEVVPDGITIENLTAPNNAIRLTGHMNATLVKTAAGIFRALGEYAEWAYQELFSPNNFYQEQSAVNADNSSNIVGSWTTIGNGGTIATFVSINSASGYGIRATKSPSSTTNYTGVQVANHGAMLAANGLTDGQNYYMRVKIRRVSGTPMGAVRFICTSATAGSHTIIPAASGNIATYTTYTSAMMTFNSAAQASTQMYFTVDDSATAPTVAVVIEFTDFEIIPA